MQDDEFTCDLFRFLQLLCEGHNSGLLIEWQQSSVEVTFLKVQHRRLIGLLIPNDNRSPDPHSLG